MNRETSRIRWLSRPRMGSGLIITNSKRQPLENIWHGSGRATYLLLSRFRKGAGFENPPVGLMPAPPAGYRTLGRYRGFVDPLRRGWLCEAFAMLSESQSQQRSMRATTIAVRDRRSPLAGARRNEARSSR